MLVAAAAAVVNHFVADMAQMLVAEEVAVAEAFHIPVAPVQTLHTKVQPTGQECSAQHSNMTKKDDRRDHLYRRGFRDECSLSRSA